MRGGDRVLCVCIDLPSWLGAFFMDAMVSFVKLSLYMYFSDVEEQL